MGSLPQTGQAGYDLSKAMCDYNQKHEQAESAARQLVSEAMEAMEKYLVG